MCAVGCEYVASLDFCAHSGKVLGGKWELLVCNEENNLIGSLLSTSTKLEAVSDWLVTGWWLVIPCPGRPKTAREPERGPGPKGFGKIIKTKR